MRLLVLIGATWLGALAVGGAARGLPAEPGLALGAFALAAGALLPGAARWQRRARAAAVVLAAALAGLAAAPRARAPRDPPTGLCRLEGVVERVRHGRQGARSTLRVLSGRRLEDGAPIPREARLAVYAPLPPGGRVRLLARLRRVARYRNPTPHPAWPRPDAVDAVAHLPPGAAAEVLHHEPLLEQLEGARATVRRALDRTLPPRTAGIARALVVGDGGAVEEDDRDAVREAGLAHVLAVSGLHVSLVAGLAFVLLSALLVRIGPLARRLDTRRIAAAGAVPLALLHALLAGGSPSAWRAAITATLALALLAAGRRPRPLAVAAAAVLVLGVTDPATALRPATLLSVLATVAVLTTRPPSAGTARAWLRAAFALSARTTIATAPVVLWCFGAVPLVGVLANVVLLPLATALLVPLALLHALVATAAPPLALITAAPLDAVARAFVAACGAFASLAPGARLPPPTVAQGIALALGCAGVLSARKLRTGMVVAAVTVVALAAAEVHVRHVERPVGLLRATFVDVGQGDAAVLDLPDGEAILVDAGGTRAEAADPGRRVIVPLLRARRRRKLAAAVLTHPHPDHYGGLRAVLHATSVAELWDNGQAEAEQPGGEAASLITGARGTGVRVMRPATVCQRTRRFGAARVEVLAPCPRYDPGRELNDNSFVLRVRLGRRALLLAGDAEAAAEAALLESGHGLDADVLKVGHHGSRTSSTRRFLAAVHPSIAVVSAGQGNRFGHPHAEVLRRLQAMGARVWRTDRDGGVVVTTDGEWVEVHSWSGRAASLRAGEGGQAWKPPDLSR